MAKIMLVEDDNNLREIYGERLMAEGYEIVSASNGEEALAIAVKERPDLIISDVMMPKISGFDMLDILRQTPETKNTKIIMMTALSQLDDKARADRLGADKYLVKSQVTLEDVARVVHDILNGPAEPAAAAAAAPAIPEPPTPAAAAAAAVTPEPVQPPQPQPATAPPAAAPAVSVPTPPSAGIDPAPVPQPPAPTQPTVAPLTVAAPPSNPKPVDVPEVTSEGTEVPVPSADAETPPAVSPPANNIEPTIIGPAPDVETTPPSFNPNPVDVEPVVESSMTAQTDATATGASAAAPQTVEQEVDAVAEQIESFLHSDTPTASHVEPVVDPSTIPVNVVPASAPVSGNPPTSLSATTKPAPATVAGPPESQPDNSIPTYADAPDADVPVAPSQRKKVIAPINDPAAEPNIYELYEKEMAEEAATVPETQPTEVINTSTNPLTVESRQEPTTTPPLETLDVSQISGVRFDTPETSTTQTNPSTTPPVAPQPLTDPKDPSNIAL